MVSIEFRPADWKGLLQQPFREGLREAGVETLIVGHTSCHHLVPNAAQVKELLPLLRDFRVKLEIPLTFESHFEKSAGLLDEVAGAVNGIIVNDLGVLRYASRTAADNLKRVSIGSGLSYSYLQCPWHGHIIREEPDEVKASISSGSFANDMMLDFLEEFPFSFEIEVPAIPGIISSFTAARNAGIAVNAVLMAIPISFARACHTCRFRDRSPEKCGLACLDKATIRPTHRWDFFEGDVKEMANYVKEQMPPFLVFGNSIHIPNTYELSAESILALDAVTIDERYLAAGDNLSSTISSIQQYS